VAVPSEDLADKYWWECVCVCKLSPRGLHFFWLVPSGTQQRT
jgi:hypothetical protein